jgi:diguanylate cyclase (GGDEF)-like protein/PAS domain S-box-containing protein
MTGHEGKTLKSLSYLSFTIFIFYAIMSIEAIKRNPGKKLNQLGFLICLSLAIWSLCYAFLYGAPTAEVAFYWHRMGTFGWSLFPALIAHMFLILANEQRLLKSKWQVLAFYMLPLMILYKNLFNPETCAALSFTQSRSGLGWTFVNTPANVWTWIYLCYIVLYLGGALYYLRVWQKKSFYANEKKQASFFIVIVELTLLLGLFTDIIMPFFSPLLPPLSNILIAFYIIGYFFLNDKLELFTFSKIASPDIVLETIMDPVLILDQAQTILNCNAAIEKVLGYKKRAIIGRKVKHIFANPDLGEAVIMRVYATQRIKNIEVNLLTASNGKINATVSATVIDDQNAGFRGIVVTFHDVTIHKKIEDALVRSREKYRKKADELFFSANYDVLTQLPNRHYFFVRMDELSQNAAVQQEDFALVYMDVNDFKQINDNYGHDTGDHVLVAVAKRLLSSVLADEFLARIGGDEFTILIPGVKSNDQIIKRISQIKKAFTEPFCVAKQPLVLSISAGYAIFSRSENDIDTMIRNADLMMYQDKPANEIFSRK